MEIDELVRLRLVRQKLRAPHAASPEDALKNLLAVQSQEFPYARWSLAQRTNGTTAGQVEQAVADGRILRTHILRPTWHFVHRDDLRWLTELSRPRLHQGNKSTYRQTGIEAAEAARSDAVLAEAVAGGRHKTREELAAILEQAGFAAQRLRLAYLVMHAEINGVLVSGTPFRSKGGALKQSYGLFDERVPAASLDRDAALARLALRYFSSRGPATVKDCAFWSGLTMTEIRHGLRLAADEHPGLLETFTVDGAEFHLGPADYAADAPGASVSGYSNAPESEDPEVAGGRPRVDLIQCYDEYVMGYSQTRRYLGGTLPFFPGETPMHAVLLDGRVAGFWRHSFVRGTCELDIRLAQTLDPLGERALDDAVAAYGAFLEMPVRRL